MKSRYVPAVYKEEVVPAVYEESCSCSRLRIKIVPADRDEEGNVITPLTTEEYAISGHSGIQRTSLGF